METRVGTIVAISLLLTGCTAIGPAAADRLDGREFLSSRVAEGSAERLLIPGTRIRISFDDGTLSASAGCNILGGRYRLEEGRLVVGSMSATEMGCDPARHAQDEWLAAVLGSRPAVGLSDTELVIDTGVVSVTLVDREIADPDLPLVGTAWKLTSLIRGGAVMSVPDEVVSRLQFAADGTVDIDPGCNSGSGTYGVADGRIVFSDFVLTRMFCEGVRSEVEQSVLGVLSGHRVGYEIEAASLTLTVGDLGLQYGGR